MIADEAAGLAAASALPSFNDGKARLLVDTLAVWPNVVYHEFRPHGAGRTADGRCFRSYQATFFHLTDP
ncbi:MAG: hypothetical protein U0835_10365 [Isosphaeraceae bacterium]